MAKQLQIPAATRPVDLVKHDDCELPIPAFMLDLPWATTTDDAVNEIVARMLESDSIDALLDRPETVEFKELIGHTIMIYSVMARPSTLDEGLGAYVVVDFTRHGSEVHEVTTTSALGVMAQLTRAHQLGLLPMVCSVQEVNVGKKGRSNPLYLAKGIVEASF